MAAVSAAVEEPEPERAGDKEKRNAGLSVESAVREQEKQGVRIRAWLLRTSDEGAKSRCR